MPIYLGSSSDINPAPAARKNLLYRYRAINDWLEPILKRDELYFSDKEGLNDPFDLDFLLSVRIDKAKLRERFESEWKLRDSLHPERMLIDPDRPELLTMFLPFVPFVLWKLPEEYARSAEKYFAWRRGVMASDSFVGGHRVVRDQLRRYAGKIGVCCFSRAGDDVLMFSHYADSHRGCCLEFDCDDDEGRPTSIFPSLSLADHNDVSYHEDGAQVRYFEASLLEFNSAMFYRKAPRWSYEREVRFVRIAGAGVEKFRRAALTGITFGCKTTVADQRRVIKWLGPGRKVQLRKAIKDRSNLKIVPL
jgi:hypothetical protein